MQSKPIGKGSYGSLYIEYTQMHQFPMIIETYHPQNPPSEVSTSFLLYQIDYFNKNWYQKLSFK